MARYRNINWQEHADEARNYFDSIGSYEVPRFEVKNPKHPLSALCFLPSPKNKVLSYILVTSNDSMRRINNSTSFWQATRKKTVGDLKFCSYQNCDSIICVRGRYKARGFYKESNEVFWFVHFDPYAEAKHYGKHIY